MRQYSISKIEIFSQAQNKIDLPPQQHGTIQALQGTIFPQTRCLLILLYRIFFFKKNGKIFAFS